MNLRHRRSYRQEAARKAWLAQAMAWPEGPWPCAEGADELANRRNDSATVAYTQKLPADDPRYKAVVAEPTMAAIDAMPAQYRALIHRFGYVDVYRAWKRGWRTDRIEMMAERAGGVFAL